jgi:tRNA pseudouridine55 synthase
MLDMTGAERIAEEGPEHLEARLLPADQALSGWPACRLPPDESRRFTAGQAVAVEEAGSGSVRVYSQGNGFLGIGELTGDGQLAPRRVFRNVS